MTVIVDQTRPSPKIVALPTEDDERQEKLLSDLVQFLNRPDRNGASAPLAECAQYLDISEEELDRVVYSRGPSGAHITVEEGMVIYSPNTTFSAIPTVALELYDKELTTPTRVEKAQIEKLGSQGLLNLLSTPETDLGQTVVTLLKNGRGVPLKILRGAIANELCHKSQAVLVSGRLINTQISIEQLKDLAIRFVDGAEVTFTGQRREDSVPKVVMIKVSSPPDYTAPPLPEIPSKEVLQELVRSHNYFDPRETYTTKKLLDAFPYHNSNKSAVPLVNLKFLLTDLSKNEAIAILEELLVPEVLTKEATYSAGKPRYSLKRQ